MRRVDRDRLQPYLDAVKMKEGKHYHWTLSNGLRVPCREFAVIMVARLAKKGCHLEIEYNPDLFNIEKPACYVYLGFKAGA